MKKLAFVPLLAVALVTSGCFKLSSDSTVNNDGSATIKVSMTRKVEVLEMMTEMIKMQLDQHAEQVGEDNPQIVDGRAAIASLETGFDEKKVAAEWKALGLDVTKSSSSDKDGWRGFEMEGSTKSLPEYHKKIDARKAAESKPSGGTGFLDLSAFRLPRMPRFYKTDQPNVAKVVTVWRDRGRQDRMLENPKLSDEDKEQLEAQLEGARAQMGLDDLKIEMKIKLPGKILSVNNCKQEGENVVVFTFAGASLGADSIADMTKNPWATIQIDPKEFKIPLEDEPKAASRPASQPASRKTEEPK